ncbi:MAG: hypothetical protein Q4F17_10130 [Eubacteriales bacterium]|nr:hypothetical protein [Eubacteriales bacterium]
MREIVIRLTSVQDVQSFVAISTVRPFQVTVSDGSRQVNGKSFMEMFCLNFSRPLILRVACSDVELDEFRQALARFTAGS